MYRSAFSAVKTNKYIFFLLSLFAACLLHSLVKSRNTCTGGEDMYKELMLILLIFTYIYFFSQFFFIMSDSTDNRCIIPESGIVDAVRNGQHRSEP